VCSAGVSPAIFLASAQHKRACETPALRKPCVLAGDPKTSNLAANTKLFQNLIGFLFSPASLC
jgi:hypothetical protein